MQSVAPCLLRPIDGTLLLVCSFVFDDFPLGKILLLVLLILLLVAFLQIFFRDARNLHIWAAPGASGSGFTQKLSTMLPAVNSRTSLTLCSAELNQQLRYLFG